MEKSDNSQNEMDNSRLENLIKDFDNGWTMAEFEEFNELFRKSQLFMPVCFNENIFEGIENLAPGDIFRPKNRLGFNINYLKLENDKLAIPLFTASRIMESAGLKSSAIAIFMSDLAAMIKEADKYSFVIINPFADSGIQMPFNAFLDLFNENKNESD